MPDRILIASTIVPFIEGGGTLIVDSLAQELRNRDYLVDVLKIPFHSHYLKMPEQMLALRLLDVSHAADLLITIRTPSYILNHPNKVAWFIHHHRGAYDLWGTEYQDIPNTPEGLAYRDFMIRTDNTYLKEARKIYTNSRVVSDRLLKFNNIASTVLYPPLPNPSQYQSLDYGDYLFYPSRITPHKRQSLAIEAMKHTRSAVKLIIAGNPETPEHLRHIKATIEKNDLTARVTLLDRWISEDEKIALYAKALGVIYIPLDEDSYGYPTLEAFQSRKPVITCVDSGGTLEIIENKVNGYVVPPNAKDIANSMDSLFRDRQLTRTMGHNGWLSIREKNITWDNVVNKLLV